EARARGEGDRGSDEHVGDPEAPADEILVSAERVRDGVRRGGEAPARLGGALGVALAEYRALDERRLQLRRSEARPLIGERPAVRSERVDQARIRVQVGEMQADRGRLEYEPLVVLQHGHAAKWMAPAVLLAASLLPVHHRELVGLAELLEHPDNSDGPASVLAVIDAQHRLGR